MIRVAMVSKACIVGIYQRKLELIAQANVDLLVLVPTSWHDERGEMPLERAYTRGYRMEALPLGFNGNYHLHYYVGLGRRLRDFQPDILHIDEEPYNLAAWQGLYHAGSARTVFFSWQNIQRTYPPPFSWGERWMLKKVDYALVGTESAGTVWRSKGYNGPMATVPQFGTDPELFRPAVSRPDRPFTIGYIGRLVEEKGVRVLLRAAAKLTGEWRLRILGGGPLRDVLAAEATRLGIVDRVTFAAQIPSTEMPPYYHHLDTLVLPSLTRPNWKEQFGRVLVEAMASGVPVIGSDSGAIPDVIGAAGRVVAEGDVGALAGTLQCLMDDTALRSRLREAGRQRVIDRFTHAQVAAATVAVYRQMMW